MVEDIKLLLRIADEDLEHGKDYERGEYRYSGFFAQQAVKKYLKAYLLYNKSKFLLSTLYHT